MNHCLNTTWQPCPATRLKLKQWGFSNGRTIDLLKCYKNSFSHYDYCDNQFLKFCTQNATDIVSDVLSVTKHWQPSKNAVQFLEEAGLPVEHIQKKYVPYFISDYSNKNIIQASWDKAFIHFAMGCWHRDPSNPKAKLSRPIKHDWFPSDRTIEILRSEGLNQQTLIQKALEYRLYWRDAGDCKIDWDKAFSDWILRY